MTKAIRQKIYDKFDGRCAYTGKPLDDGWQVDHMISKEIYIYRELSGNVNHIDNLMPTLQIVNHYKRAKDLEGFRNYMLNFHKRLAKLPKRTLVQSSERRKKYMLEIADAFDITPDKPFNGKFYFEKYITND